MASVIEPTALQAAAAEAKAYLRVEGAGEDLLLGRLVGTATALCEGFTGQRLLIREDSEVVPVSAAWTRLAATPVRAILGVDTLPPDGEPQALAVSGFAIDIDAAGDGWVRVLDAGGARRARVRFEAGVAASWEEVPEALRHGIIRLATHLFMHRDGAADQAPPAAVSALWRPWRRMRLA